MGELFGTDGIRGVAGEFPLDVTTIERIGYVLAGELKARLDRGPYIVVGGDTRESTAWIESAFARGAQAAEAQVCSAGVITTPGLAYLARVLGADAGVVISASHNPYRDNGIKVFGPSGGKLDEATERAIEGKLRNGTGSFPSMLDTAIESDPLLTDRYLAFLRDEMAAGLDLKQMRLAVDCANGAASALAPRLFSALGASVHAINAEPNGRNINLDCGSLHPGKLAQLVREHKANIGMAFDGDADRLLLVDEHGAVVNGDHIMYILAKELDRRGRLSGRRVVATVMSNIGLELALAEHNIKLVRTQVGDKYVLEELLTNGGSIGGEQSGHIILPDISLAGDGIITALEILRLITTSGKSLGQLTNGLKSYPQVLVNVRVSSKPPLDTVVPVQAAIAALEKEIGNQGRLLVRYSGTENLARVMLEGKDDAVIRRQADDLASLIRQHIG